MRGRSRRDRAFTLVELLAVVAIVSLLLAMLVPAFQKARELARRARCMTVFRELGTAANGFAANNGGRGPGCGGRWVHPDLPTDDPNRYYSGPSWVTVLNREYYGTSRIAGTVYFDSPVRNRNQLVCPSMQRPTGFPVGYTYNYWILMNNDAQGCNRGRPLVPTYGRMVPVSHLYNDYSPRLTEYHLGARLYLFPRTAWQVLFQESESFGNTTLLPSHAVEILPLTSDPARLGFYSGPSGHHVFRHLRTSVFTFIDGHAEALAPEDQLDKSTRYTFRQ